jgi:glutathione S-transferase
MIGEKGYLRQFEKYSKPIMKAILSRGYQLNSDKVAESKQRMDILVDVLNQRLIENHGRYFVGERLGLADIAVCSMLAPLLEIAGTPWELETFDSVSEQAYAFSSQLQALAVGQYVHQIYAEERQARVDWRGI